MSPIAGKRYMWRAALLILAATTSVLLMIESPVKLVYVYSDGCGYCASFSPTFEQVIEEYLGIEVERLHIQRADDYAEAKRLGATATPRVFIVRWGDVVAKLEGDVPEKAFRRFLQKNLADRGER